MLIVEEKKVCKSAVVSISQKNKTFERWRFCKFVVISRSTEQNKNKRKIVQKDFFFHFWIPDKLFVLVGQSVAFYLLLQLQVTKRDTNDRKINEID